MRSRDRSPMSLTELVYLLAFTTVMALIVWLIL